LPKVGKSITSTQYKSKPQDPPVNVHVVDTGGDPAAAVQALSGTVVSNSPGAVTTGVRVQSPTGAEYTGAKVKTPQSETYVLGKPAGTVVIVIYAPDPAVIATADRLAADVGNGAGLNADPGVTGMIGNLPAQLPTGMQLVELHTYDTADVGLLSQQLGQSLGGQLGDPGQLGSQAQRFMPASLVAARYQDPSRKDFNVLVGEYGSTLSAWKTWLLLRVTAGLTKMTSVNVGGANGLTLSQNGQQFLLFQTGPHMAVVAGPQEPTGGRVTQLAQALQF
jgi:hypothetical protein